jgi:hypothetical protein
MASKGTNIHTHTHIHKVYMRIFPNSIFLFDKYDCMDAYQINSRFKLKMIALLHKNSIVLYIL